MVVDTSHPAPSVQPAVPADWSELHRSDHLVQFYQADDFLIESAGEFLAAPLRAGDSVVVIATAPHQRAFAERLLAGGIDLAAARDSDRFITLDAAETLTRFMVEGMPDARLFADTITPILARAAGDRRQVRAFGEMVALLAHEGNVSAAIALEALWNDLQRRQPFSLLCAYPLLAMRGEARDELFRQICGQHSRVLPAESYLALPTADERLRAVAELQQKAQQLEAAVADLRHAEAAVRGERETVRRLRDEFLSIAAHELRNPLAGLSLRAQLALRRLTRDGHLDPSWGSEALHAINAQATKLTRLLDQLLDDSRLNTGTIALEPRQIDLTALVAQVVADARAWSQRHAIRVIAPPSLPAQVDPLRLEQVLANLLHNAIKYTPPVGIIDVVLSQPQPDRVELIVQDNGPGIPADAREAVFERFVPANAGDASRGLGLGLYLSRQIVELHGGGLDLELPAEGGTRFIIRLPTIAIGYQLSANGSETTNREPAGKTRRPISADELLTVNSR